MLHRLGSDGRALETLPGEHGQILIGWIDPDALFASFHGGLSDELVEAYAERLLQGRTRVRYFLDSSALDSFELKGPGSKSATRAATGC